MKTIAIQGAYGEGNFGDDALMQVVCKLVSSIDGVEKVILVCRDAPYLAAWCPDVEVVSDATKCPACDLYIYGGGTQFYSFDNHGLKRRPLWKKVASRVYQEWLYQYQKVRKGQASTRRVNVAALGIGVGPFRNGLSKRRIVSHLNTMDFVAVRDLVSYLHCEKALSTKLKMGADLCFLPTLWKGLEYENCSSRTPECSRVEKIGIIVRDWTHTKEGAAYYGPLQEVVSSIVDSGKQVSYILLSGEGDSQWCRILDDLGEEPLAWNPSEENVSDFIGQMKEYDLFITARYHGAVFASLIGKPSVIIEVENKLALAAEMFGLAARLWSNPFNVQDCLSAIEELESDYPRVTEHLQKVVGEQGEAGQSMVGEFYAYVSSLQSR